MLTQKQLDEIRARCDAATPGPWAMQRANLTGCWTDTWVEGLALDDAGTVCADVCVDDAIFIAATRQDIPALLAEVERLHGHHDTTGTRQTLGGVLCAIQAAIALYGMDTPCLFVGTPGDTGVVEAYGPISSDGTVPIYTTINGGVG